MTKQDDPYGLRGDPSLKEARSKQFGIGSPWLLLGVLIWNNGHEKQPQ